MLTKDDILRRRAEIIAIARRHGASHIRIFGSVARGDTNATSDVDLIVRFEPDRSLFDHGGLIVDLEELLGVKVDVVSEAGMRDRFRDQVNKEAIAI
jgi:predicted nucleotidyltransferase